ncbi:MULTISPECIES: M48 family metallopeptidase [unclassified Acidisoma]|jgi:predicted metal-dependent hydrolase|uniref:M48 family metallopeptidase n=1 Tax=unclassified Acidisoma TaxID=2634065 RepID=UPI0020B13ECA|nr:MULTISPECIES: SprT family zinc-dependent metalloprotease [unclassified Acidisoma]
MPVSRLVATEPEIETVAMPGGPVQVKWRRSGHARRLTLRIDPRDGTVVVTLPMRSSRRTGLTMLKDHADWVRGRLAALPESIVFADGAEVPVHGTPHAIRHHRHRPGAASIEAGEIIVSGDPAFLRRRVADCLRLEARRRLTALAWEKATVAGLKPRRVLIKDTRSRWGSCAPDGTLAFSWRLVMAPPRIQAYVAAHEAAHLRHLDHGRAFWSLVGELHAGWERDAAWLRRDGPRLMRIG